MSKCWILSTIFPSDFDYFEFEIFKKLTSFPCCRNSTLSRCPKISQTRNIRPNLIQIWRQQAKNSDHHDIGCLSFHIPENPEVRNPRKRAKILAENRTAQRAHAHLWCVLGVVECAPREQVLGCCVWAKVMGPEGPSIPVVQSKQLAW